MISLSGLLLYISTILPITKMVDTPSKFFQKAGIHKAIAISTSILSTS